jgi:hypothetical protein
MTRPSRTGKPRPARTGKGKPLGAHGQALRAGADHQWRGAGDSTGILIQHALAKAPLQSTSPPAKCRERVDTPGLVDAGQRHSPLLQAGALALIAGRTIFCPVRNQIDRPQSQRCPVNLYRSRTYIVITRLASLSLVAVVLLLTAGCHSHRYHDDDGWRDRDRDVTIATTTAMTATTMTIGNTAVTATS